jgi:thiamine pyrophosphokinase
MFLKNADLVVCADGAVDLFDFEPDYCVGDMDSTSKSKKTVYITNNDQSTTDFEKCLDFVAAKSSLPVFALSGLQGRLDHVFQNVNLLHHPSNPIIIDSHSLAVLLHVGQTTILADLEFEGPTCGLFPLGSGQCETTGLEWNLKWDMKLGFGPRSILSTSNRFDKKTIVEHEGKQYHKVTVNANCRMLWTCEVRYNK